MGGSHDKGSVEPQHLSVEPPTSLHFGYCLKLMQYYLKKSNTKVYAQQRRCHHAPTKLRKKTCSNLIGSKQ
jgi:hypothetical protein